MKRKKDVIARKFRKGVLWKCQYSPREKTVKCMLNKDALRKWKKLSMIQKVKVIDNLQAKGYFGEEKD